MIRSDAVILRCNSAASCRASARAFDPAVSPKRKRRTSMSRKASRCYFNWARCQAMVLSLSAIENSSLLRRRILVRDKERESRQSPFAAYG